MLGDEQWAQGCRLLDEGNGDEAVAVWREALRLNADHADARYNIGVVLSQTGHVDAAMTEWRETVRRCPHFWQANENLGYVFLKRAYDEEQTPGLASGARCLQAGTGSPS